MNVLKQHGPYVEPEILSILLSLGSVDDVER
jgi:hypothetical protein